MYTSSCCFSGHRKLPATKLQHIATRLYSEIDKLIQKGVTTYIVGGARGFDLIAASMVFSRKENGDNIRLVFALPCHNHDEKWTADEKDLFRSLLKKADEIIYVSEEYDTKCMKRRNYYMVDHSAYCICALLYNRSGTSQTVAYAHIKGLQVINVAE